MTRGLFINLFLEMKLFKKLTVILLLMSNFGFTQDKYAEINYDDLRDYSEFDEFFDDSVMRQFSVFFTGENHQYAKVNSETEFKFLLYLHEKVGVNHFLFEQGPALGYIINKITVEDDLDFRYYLEDRFYGPYFDLVNNIRKYNEKIADSLRIKTHGIDVDRFPSYAIFVLNHLIDSLPTQGVTGRIYESIKALGSSEFEDASPDDIYNSGGTRFNLNGETIDAWSTFNTIIYDSGRLSDSLKVELGENYNIYMEIIESVEKGHQWYHEEKNGDLTGPITRERFMVAQFARVVEENPGAKFYGQFGRCHLNSNKTAKTCYSYDMASIAKRINDMNDPFYNNKVLAIPIVYKTNYNYDLKIIKMLDLDYKFDDKNTAYLLDLSYLKGDNPLVGFGHDLEYMIVNNYQQGGSEDFYSNETYVEEVHLGAYVKRQYTKKLSSLNNELSDKNVGTFNTTLQYYTFAFDYFDLKTSSAHISYSFMPEISNGDNFTLSSRYFTVGSAYPFGNKNVLGAFGLNYSFGNFVLKEEIQTNNDILIQSDQKNIVAYKNDVMFIDPNFDFRITFPLISFNAKVGYNWDVSGKYWKLDKKIKDFTKTKFSSPYIMVGASFNFKSEY